MPLGTPQTDPAAPNTTSGSGAPTTTPTAIGDVFVDTLNDVYYVATGTASSADWIAATGISEVSQDTTPQLGGALDVNGQEITGAIDLHSTGDIIAELGDDAGTNKVSILDSGAVEVAAIDSDGNITTSGTVDGRDIASDGTKLDGIETGATADQTAADIRTLGFFDVSNDGTGSGLDADLLDGQEASAFAAASHTHVEADITDLGDYATNAYVPKVLSTTPKTTGFTAAIGETHFVDTSSGGFTATLPAIATEQGRIAFYFTGTGGNLTLDPNASETIEGKATIKLDHGHNTIENDGSEWKLIQRSGVSPSRLDPAQITGDQDGYNPTDWSNDITHLYIDSDASRNISGIEEDGFTDMQSVVVTNDGSNPIVIKHDAGTTLSSRVLVDGGADVTLGANQSGILMRDGTANRWRFYAFLSDVSQLTAAQIRALGFFDTSNDGAGSGLDADLLDGNEASAFALSSHSHTTADITDITAAGAALIDDANAAAQRTTLGVDPAGTDNSTDVTLAGTPDYITIAGQVITRNQIDLTTDVTGDLPIAEGGTGASDAATARTNLDAQQQQDILDDIGAVTPPTGADEILVSTGAGTFALESGATARTSLGLGTTDNPQFATIELGAATDTTLSRSAAGVLAVEGADVITTAGTGQQEVIGIACSDETTDLTTGTAKVTFRMPFAMTLSDVRANVNTAPTGSTLTVDINEAGVSILSTLLTIDASEETSETAATPAVISDTALADDAEMTIDIDAVGSTTAGKGLKVWLIGSRA